MNDKAISFAETAGWPNLPIQEQIADKLGDILYASDEILDMIRSGRAEQPPDDALCPRCRTGVCLSLMVRSKSRIALQHGRILAMETPIQEVRRLLDTLPQEASFEDIQYHIYVQQAVRRGLEAAERGELVEQEEVERRMSKWLGE